MEYYTGGNAVEKQNFMIWNFWLSYSYVDVVEYDGNGKRIHESHYVSIQIAYDIN
jgi:hypothetical protein